jgi:uncharacterized membrane protein
VTSVAGGTLLATPLARRGRALAAGPPWPGPGWLGPASPATWAMTGLVVAANLLALAPAPVPFLQPALGLWLILGYPVYLLGTASVWHRTRIPERLGGSLCAVLLALMLAGLGLNTVLPSLGVARPLGRIPVLALADVLVAGLGLLRRRYPPAPATRPGWPGGPVARRLLAGSGLCVLAAVLGANRLNNGAGGQLSLAALGGIVVLAALLFRWRHRAGESAIAGTIYLLSLALLLMTSLRGWYVTGHDIQTEYRAFQLTYGAGRWDMGAFRSAYNACLSITILPAELGQAARVSGPYVFKVFFQLIFAACPVMVYAIARRYWQKWAAILAAIYFIGFPTFFTDMPFLCRQEVAFLFTCAAVLALTHPRWRVHRRRAAGLAACLGVELSHYSTMYLLLGTLAVAWLVVSVAGRLRDRADAGPRPAWEYRAVVPRPRAAWEHRPAVPRPQPARLRRPARTLGAGLVLAAAAITASWGGLATHTAGGAAADAWSALSSLVGRSAGVRAGGVSYGLLSGPPPSPAGVLARYRQATEAERAGAPADYLPLSLVGRYPAPYRAALSSMPLTAAGRLLAAGGVPVARLDGFTRQAAARGEQVFALTGLATLLVVGRRRRRVGAEFCALCAGALAMVALITVLPDLSADYDVLRAFQEALIVMAPVLVAGCYVALRPLRPALAIQVSAVVCLGLFASTSGFLPQVLGGYPAQLSLNNSGQYYDAYYTHPQEAAAVAWLAGQPGVLPGGVQAENFTDRFAFSAPGEVSGRQFIGDFYPTLVRRSGWVILGYTTLHTGQASVFYDGDLVSYAYPVGLLHAAKNLVYDNGGTQIYR